MDAQHFFGTVEWSPGCSVSLEPVIVQLTCRRSLLRRYLKQAIKKGPYFVDAPEQASVIMVDDYCHKLQWLAYTHSEMETQARPPLQLWFAGGAHL